MKNNNNKLIVFVFVGILILLASLWVKNCNAETFDVNDTIAGGPSGLNPEISLSDTVPDSLFNDPNLYTDPSLNKNKDIKTLGYWLSDQLTDYNKKEHLIKNKERYIYWINFINDDKYKQYFK